MAAEKMHISYNEIHQAIADCVEREQVFEKFQPTIIIAIGSGGFIPARMLRTFLKQRCGKSLPIQTIGLVLYDDNMEGLADPSAAVVRKTQWLNYTCSEGTGISLQGHRVLIVDEVDDTRKTLHFAVAELSKDIAKQREEHEAAHQQQGEGAQQWKEPQLGIFVVHNKLKEKAGTLPADLLASRYFKCMDVPDNWIVYPWDALDIYEHQRKADVRRAAEAAAAPAAAAGAANGAASSHANGDQQGEAEAAEPPAKRAKADE